MGRRRKCRHRSPNHGQHHRRLLTLLMLILEPLSTSKISSRIIPHSLPCNRDEGMRGVHAAGGPDSLTANGWPFEGDGALGHHRHHGYQHQSRPRASRYTRCTRDTTSTLRCQLKHIIHIHSSGLPRSGGAHAALHDAHQQSASVGDIRGGVPHQGDALDAHHDEHACGSNKGNGTGYDGEMEIGAFRRQ